MRITTGMIMRNYNSHLNRTLGGLNSSRYQVETHRKFANSYEDPSSAAKGSILERRYARNLDYQNNVLNTMKWQDVQEDSLMSINDICTKVASEYSLEAINGTTSEDGRKTFAQAFRGFQESMVQILNNKYGDSFVLGGNGGTEKAPFELSEDGSTLLFRGVDVNDPANEDILKELANEKAFVDLGFGLTYDQNGDIVESSAFNYALSGISAVGYGKTQDGTSKNLVVLAGQMAKLLEAEEFDKEQYEKLWTQFKEGSSTVKDTLTQLGTKTNLLENTQTRLEKEELAIQDQYNNAVGIEAAEAITNYSWATYAYNSALKIGTSIIGPSLLDFMK